MESIRFQTSTPSSGTDSIVDTSVIIFAFLSLGKLVAELINVLHNSAISRGEYFRWDATRIVPRYCYHRLFNAMYLLFVFTSPNF